MSATEMSPLDPLRVQRKSKEYTWQDFWTELEASRDKSLGEKRWYSTIATKRNNRARDLECFADSSSIPWNPPTIFSPDLIPTVPQMSLPWFCAPLSQQSHLFLDRWRVTRFAKFWGIDSVSDFWFPRRLQELLQALFSFPEKFLFYMGMIASTVLPSLVPLQRIDDCFRDSHRSQRTLWSAII